MTRPLFTLLALAALLHGGATQVGAQQSPDALQFFKNYFVTGDYVVAGVGLHDQGVGGIATGTVTVAGVPEGADVLAAFLYWQVVTKESAGADAPLNGVSFNGFPLSSVDGPYGKVLGAGSPPCWSSGGGTGSSGGANRTFTARADVLRFFRIDSTGEVIANGPHQVKLPDGNGVSALGASLVVIYRDPTQPLRAIVLYDGTYTMDQRNESMFQTIRGFYQAANADGKLTHVVGSGQANKSERIYFNGFELEGSVNPFRSAEGLHWDNPTYVVNPNPENALVSQVSTSVDHAGFNSFDCLSWAAVVTRFDVVDTDADGLLDVWESSSNLVDPNGLPLPNLPAMGADPNVKDLFIEIDYMRAGPDPRTGGLPTYGGTPRPVHDHLPSAEALEMMGRAFKKSGINVHFDVGNNYQNLPVQTTQCDSPTNWSLGCGIVPMPYARGGDVVDEYDLVLGCTVNQGDPPWKCQYAGHPGTVGWKTGFRYLKDEVLKDANGNKPTATDGCDLPGNRCQRRFESNRRDMFHYAFFGHAIGLPKSLLPCLDAAGTPVSTVPGTTQCDGGRINPDFLVPRTNTGVADFPGGDVLVTLGGFLDAAGRPVGTPFMQASTLAHELGHNLGLRHGGKSGDPNCKPTYLSVMNYLYQLRGLLDDDGKPHLDFSSKGLDVDPLDERNLTDGYSPTAIYRIGWYAPLVGSYLEGRARAAQRHCDGSELSPQDQPMVRLDARQAATPIDWRGNGTEDPDEALDINFNGRATDSLESFDDWANLKLNQRGARRNVAGAYTDSEGRMYFGPLSLDMGRLDLGRLDLGRLDLGRLDLGRLDLGRLDLGRLDLGRLDLGQGDLHQGDFGRLDLGRLDLGRLDLGRLDLGRGELGRGDFGGGDLFTGDPDNPGGELDTETAGDLANTPPNEFRACTIGGDASCVCPSVDPNACQVNQLRADFKASNIGGVQSYQVYCVAGTALVPDTTSTPWLLMAQAATVPAQTDYTLLGGAPLAKGTYTCFSTATYSGTVSDPSNLREVVAVNRAPVAGVLQASTNEDAPVGITLTGSDVDNDPLTFAVATPPANGTLSGTAPALTYTPSPDFNGADSFTFTISDGTVSTLATMTITVAPVNDPPAAFALSVTATEDTAAPITLSASDVDGDALTYTIVSGPTAGTLSGTAPDLTYLPRADFNGQDAFSFKASDGQYETAVVVVSITVGAVNDAPRAVNDSYSMPQGGTLTIAAPGVLGNDTDVDAGTALTASLVSVPSVDGLTLNADGSFTYTPPSAFAGTVTFTYTASDGRLTSAPATVTIAVKAYTFYGLQNAPPAPIAKSFKAGSSIPMKWQFRDGPIVVSSAQVAHRVTVTGAGGTYVITNTDPGSSSFRYDSTTNTWNFNLQTKDGNGTAYPVGDYVVTVTPTTPGYLPSPPFSIKLVK